MIRLLDESLLEHAINCARESYRPENERPAVNRFLYEMAYRVPLAPPPHFFEYMRRFGVQLRAEALLGWDGLEAEMRKVGQILIAEQEAS